jgi:pSer/pThr/pTyr-binding forkhead associated (FHA) protein
MAKIQVFFAADLQGEYMLDDKFEVKVGRDPTCDIVINNVAVSRHHCTIREVKRQWTLFDEGSSNGTYVNGQRISEYVLKHKDRVVLGKHTLLFDSFGKGPEPSRKQDQEEDQLAGDGTIFVSPGALASILERSKKQQSMGLVLSGAKRQVLTLNKAITTIGSGPDCDLRIRGLFVKKEQAFVLKTENGYKITHQGGWRAMYVNGEKRNEVMLSAGDVITIAGNKISYGSL